MLLKWRLCTGPRKAAARSPGERGPAPGPGRAPAGLIVRFDRGSRYAATRFLDLLARHRALAGMSRRGGCHDNAPAEPFWHRLQTKLLDGGSCPGLEEARREISCLVAHYSAERRRSAPAYHSPNRFETQVQPTSRRCPA